MLKKVKLNLGLQLYFLDNVALCEKLHCEFQQKLPRVTGHLPHMVKSIMIVCQTFYELL